MTALGLNSALWYRWESLLRTAWRKSRFSSKPYCPEMIDLLLEALQGLDRPALPSHSPVVVLHMVRESMFYACLAVTLARVFETRGRRSVILLDDGQCSSVDGIRAGATEDRFFHRSIERWNKVILSNPSAVLPAQPMVAEIRSRLEPWLVDHAEAQFLPVSRVLAERPLDQDLFERRWSEAMKQGLEGNVLSSFRRCMGGRAFDADDACHRAFAGLAIRAEMIYRNVGQWIWDEHRPEVHITLDGAYVTFGTLLEDMRSRGVSCKVFQPMFFHGRMLAMRDRPYVLGFGREELERFERTELPAEALDEARGFLADRTSASRREPSREEIQWRDRIARAGSEGKRVVGLFPNLPWDAGLYQRDLLFDSMGHWLAEMFEWSRRTGHVVVLREHPRSVEQYNRWESSGALLKETVSDVEPWPESVWIIQAPSRVSSFALLDKLDLSVVYSSTIGMEIAYLGSPVAFAGRSPYYKMGVGYQPQTPEEYMDLLESAGPETQDFSERRDGFRQQAVKAAAWHFFERGYHCPLMPTSDRSAHQGKRRYWKSWDLSDGALDPGRSASWSRTVDAFLDKQPAGVSHEASGQNGRSG